MDEAFRLVGRLAGLLQPLLSLALGLALTAGALARAARRPVVLRAIPAALLGVPLVAIAVVRLLPIGPIATGLLLLMSVCPGVILIGVSQGKEPERLPAAVATAVILMVAGLLTLSLAFSLLERLFPVTFRLDASAVLRKVLLPVLLPLAAGMGVRALSPRVASRLHRAMDLAFKATLGLVALALVVSTIRVWGQLHAVDLLALLLVVAASALLGHLIGAPDDTDRELAATALVLGNPALALLVAGSSYPEVNVGLLLGVSVVFRVLALAPYRWLLKRRRARGGPPARAPLSGEEAEART